MEVDVGIHTYTENDIRRVGSLLPPRDNCIIDRDGFMTWSEERGIENAQRELDAAILSGELRQVDPGIKTRIVFWNGIAGSVVAFDHDGRQIGYGQIYWYPDTREREIELEYLMYHTAYVVGSDYTGRGIGTAMKEHLENFAAVHNGGVGAAFSSHVEAATPSYREAAERLLEKLEAVSLGEEGYLRSIVKSGIEKQREVEGVVVINVDYAAVEVNYSAKSQKRHRKKQASR
jgi:GNAT superfamily N-acetyltransferase